MKHRTRDSRISTAAVDSPFESMLVEAEDPCAGKKPLAKKPTRPTWKPYYWALAGETMPPATSVGTSIADIFDFAGVDTDSHLQGQNLLN
jgi:hypothetical protein